MQHIPGGHELSGKAYIHGMRNYEHIHLNVLKKTTVCFSVASWINSELENKVSDYSMSNACSVFFPCLFWQRDVLARAELYLQVDLAKSAWGLATKVMVTCRWWCWHKEDSLYLFLGIELDWLKQSFIGISYLMYFNLSGKRSSTSLFSLWWGLWDEHFLVYRSL